MMYLRSHEADRQTDKVINIMPSVANIMGSGGIKTESNSSSSGM